MSDPLAIQRHAALEEQVNQLSHEVVLLKDLVIEATNLLSDRIDHLESKGKKKHDNDRQE